MAATRWRDSALVNPYAEVFQAASNDVLPVFVGPDGTDPEVYRHYQSFSRTLAPLGKRPREIVLSDRGAWRHRWPAASRIHRRCVGDRG